MRGDDMEHTPGPWKTESTLIWAPDAKAVIAQVSELRTSDTVKFTPPSISSPDFHEIVANARLIAAAPELLGALEAIAKMHIDGDTDHAQLSALCIATARAAIKAARKS
jgi:hypothetical protein